MYPAGQDDVVRGQKVDARRQTPLDLVFVIFFAALPRASWVTFMVGDPSLQPSHAEGWIAVPVPRHCNYRSLLLILLGTSAGLDHRVGYAGGGWVGFHSGQRQYHRPALCVWLARFADECCFW